MTPSGPRPDVLVAGGGPAAWAVAGAAGRAGLKVVLVAPEPEPVWAATYALWADELVGTGLDPSVVRRRWPAVRVVAGESGERRLDRGYVLLDTGVLAAALVARAAAAGVVVERGAVAGAAGEHDGVAVVLSDGRVRSARAVVDATGAPAALVRAAPPPAWQVAHGIVVANGDAGRLAGPATPDQGACLLMDWTPVPGEADRQPSFLYALDLGDGRTLLEETVLAAARPLAPAALARRLERRLAVAGVAVGDVLATETVRIPMGLGAPRPQVVVGFGAAAGLVHPATGYSIAASLRLAPRLADALAAGIRRGATPAALAGLGWDAVWPADRRRARALEAFGADAVLRMDAEALGSFFGAFFVEPTEGWAGYLAGTLPARDVAALMTRLFRRAPWTLRRRLAAGDPRSLLRARRG